MGKKTPRYPDNQCPNALPRQSPRSGDFSPADIDLEAQDQARPGQAMPGQAASNGQNPARSFRHTIQPDAVYVSFNGANDVSAYADDGHAAASNDDWAAANAGARPPQPAADAGIHATAGDFSK
ncbi:unnamed protein product [Phytophthora fragariaefolia]|uniref:Unnamed protein product n=1 Tax=Phytophthora fragariaefolia TaxID=1490495 RepID=A0A9W7D5I5_9STRA|nr:unnamed protein product [Phytophthora fragariaefolia]